jgi:hypothetical protein
VHRCQDPDELLKQAGTVRVTEQSWQLHETGHSGMGSVKMHHKMRVDPDAVRQASVGEAWLLNSGRALHMSVRRSPITAADRQRAMATVRQAWTQAAEDLRSGQTAHPQTWWEVPLPRLAKRRQLNVGPTFLELAAGPDGPVPLDRPTVPPPSDPTRRLLLAIIAAIREGDLRLASELAETRQQMVPEWDSAAFLARYIAKRDNILGHTDGKRPQRPKGPGATAS